MRICYLLFLLFLLSVYFVKADITFLREDYLIGDTVQSEIKIDNLVDDLTISDLKLYYNGSKINVGFFMIKLEDSYFAYFDIPLNFQGGVYELIAENVNIIEDQILKEKDFVGNFSVNLGDNALIVNPPIIKTNIDGVFDVNVKNNGNKTIDVSIISSGVNSSLDSIRLYKKENKKFQVLVENKGNWNIKLNYDGKVFEIPIYMTEEKVVSPPEINYKSVISENSISFVEDVDIINLNLKVGEVREGQIRFKNFYNGTISGVKFRLEGNIVEVVDINFTNIDLDANEEKYQYLWINRGNKTGIFSGQLILERGIIYDSFPIYVIISDDVVIPEPEPIINQTTNESSKPGSANENKKNYRWLWILVIVFIIGILIFYVWRGKLIRKDINDLISEKKT